MTMGQKLGALLGAAIIVALIVFIWALLVTFIVLFHLPLAVSNEEASVTNSQSTCSAVVYTGDICRTHLKMFQDCLTDQSNNTEIFVATSSIDLQQQAQRLLTGLNFLDPTPECRDVVEPFLCLYVFGLCDSSGELYLPSSGEYETLTTETCASEWTMAVSLLGSDQLPQCNSLPTLARECDYGNNVFNFTVSVTDVNSTDGANNSTDGPSMMCADDFYLDDSGVCLPDCRVFHLYPTATAETAASVLILIAAIFGIVSGIVVIVLSCAQYKQVFAFPSALVRYQTVSLILYDVIILMGLAGHEVFYCSSQSFLHSSQNPTPFCKLSGMVFFYVYWQVTFWWFCHVAAMFWGLKFPFQAHKFDVTGKTKYLHLTAVVLGLTIPWMPVIVAFATGGFDVGRIPTIFCSAVSNNALFYGLILPAAIAIATGLTLLILIFRTIYKEHRALTVSEENTRLPEVKVLVITSYFLGISILALVSFSLTFWFGAISEELTAYILCQSAGIQPGKLCDRSELNGIVRVQAVYDAVTLPFTLIPTVNLLYAANPRKVKQLWKNCLLCCPAKAKHSNKPKLYTTYTLDS